jgi:enoyl-CoA hydratase/carnithine racemase
VDAADPCHEPGRRERLWVKLVAGEGGKLQKRRPGVQETVDPVADEELVAPHMAIARRLRTALADDPEALTQLRGELSQARGNPLLANCAVQHLKALVAKRAPPPFSNTCHARLPSRRNVNVIAVSQAANPRSVELRRQDHIAEIVLNRPDQLNAISSAMAVALSRATAEIARDEKVRAVVVSSSNERAFCAGADLKERNQFSEAELLQQRPLIRAMFAGISLIPVATVAAVSGYALGGGLEIALSCDLIVADDTAVLGLPEVSVGLVPGGGGTQLLSRRAGIAVANDLVLTGRRVAIDEAVYLGLVHRRVPAGQARDESMALARQIASNSPVATRAAKRALRLGADRALGEALELEHAAWQEAAMSPDRREGIAAFVEKRAPDWPSG